MNFLKKYPATILLASLALFLLTVSFLGHIDFIATLMFFESYELDEIILAIFFIALGVVIDLNTIQLKHKQEIQNQKLKTIEDTVRHVKNIVNNFLHNIQLFEMETAEFLSDESKLLFRAMIDDTVERINNLSELIQNEKN